MTMRLMLATVSALAIGLGAAAVAGQAPPSAADILTRSVAAHGGDRLTAWQTLTITGTVPMRDGITYNAAFTLRAKPPGAVRVDQDMTADHGRLFYEYFLHGGVGWNRRNLVVGPYDAARMQRWLEHAYGIAFYARQPAPPVLKGEADVAWPLPSTAGGAPAPATRRAWVLAVTVGTEAREIYIDTENFHFLKEVSPAGTRTFGDFKTFGGVLWPTRMVETARGRQGESHTPFSYANILYNAPIEDWVFTEDKPKASTPGVIVPAQ